MIWPDERGSSIVECMVAFVLLATVSAPLLAMIVSQRLPVETRKRGEACLFAAEVLERDILATQELRRGKMVAIVGRVTAGGTFVHSVTVQSGEVECRLEVVRLRDGGGE